MSYEQLPVFKVKRPKHLYGNGLPFDSKLAENLDSLMQRIDDKKASLMIIDGGVGEGKTTLAVHCAEYVQKGQIDLKEQIGVGGEQFQEKLTVCVDKQQKVIIYDEAGDFNKRGALTKFNAMLNRVFETYRGFRILVILVLPSFGVLDDTLFDKQIARLLLHVQNRTRNTGNYKGFSLYRMFYIKKNMKEMTVKPHAYKRTNPNFVGHFKDLQAERSDQLERISLSEKKDIINVGTLKNKGLLTLEGLAKRMGMSEVWVRHKLKKIGHKEKTVYMRRKYYDEGVIGELEMERVRGK